MIVVQISYGLGNQMFQYAAARRLAQHKGVEFALDVSDYDRPNQRAYRLQHFNIRERLATPAETLRAQDRQGRSLPARLWRQRRKLLPYYRRRVIAEQYPFHYDPRLLELPSEAYLVGFWQNEKYFVPIADLIRAEFTLKDPLTPFGAGLAGQIEKSEAVAVHVRRGDYVHDPGINRRHGLVSPEYYRNCARQILARHPRAVFYVFSDDPRWVADNLDLGQPPVIVDHNGPERDYEDLHLMSRCQHFIIANSSFSWWAAWLSTHPGKLVYAPRRWQASGEFDTSDLVPAGWQRV